MEQEAVLPPGATPHLSGDEIKALAYSADRNDRWRLAALHDIDGPILDMLAHDADPLVRASALMQPEITTETLEEVLREYPEHEAQVMHHLHAPVYLLERLPVALAEFPGQIDRFLQAKGANEADSAKFRDIHYQEGSAHRMIMTMEDAWNSITSQS
ncbi:MAG: hypothetical protein ACRCSP_05045 [Rhodoglobus sp.]